MLPARATISLLFQPQCRCPADTAQFSGAATRLCGIERADQREGCASGECSPKGRIGEFMEAHYSRPSGVLGAKELHQQNSTSHGQLSSWGVPHGVRVVQNGRPVLEDAFSHASLEVEPAGQPCQATAGAGAFVNPTTGPLQQPLSFFGVYDGHGGAEVAHHAASKLHQHFQEAYKQLATAAQLAGVGSGSACSASSSVTLEEMLCDPWHSSSSLSTDSNGGSSGGTLADVLISLASGAHAGGPAAATSDLLSCSSPSSTASSNSGGSPTGQQVWDTINSPTAGALLPAAGSAALRLKQLKQQQQQQQQAQHAQQPSRASRVVVQALREAFLRTDADLAGTEVGEVVGTTAVTAVMSEGELFIGHCGECSGAAVCELNCWWWVLTALPAAVSQFACFPAQACSLISAAQQ